MAGLKRQKSKSYDYANFHKLDGKHPLQKKVPESCVLYRARYRKGGKVSFFNFALAKEMGLIDEEHGNELNQKLEEEILQTFSLVIINEYDLEHSKRFPKEEIKENFYMATRYLQLQHPDNMGYNSGDGRSIWNGQIKNNGKIWDVSSCGTGATRLSPATSIHNKFFETGDPSISYGCGYAEYDEGLASALMSEIFAKNKVPTERVLAIIEFPNNIAITVRAYSCLLRPSHFFLHLKQGNRRSLENMLDLYLKQQERNKILKHFPKTKKARYKAFLKQIAEDFAKASATFEDEYIFCWLDWDGDNILMDGGILDYGSIRQFGLFHHKYRFDDDDRYSTTILEQKHKARYMVQSFAQMVDFILTGNKDNIQKFKECKATQWFDDKFLEFKKKNLVYRLGFNEKQSDYLLKECRRDLHNFQKVFSYFERANSKEGVVKVADGINQNAIYSMRDILRELPQLLLSRESLLSVDEFIEIIKSNYATKSDLAPNRYRDHQIKKFQKYYKKLIKNVAKKQRCDFADVLADVMLRSAVINRMDRMTGDAITHIVNKLIQLKPKLDSDSLYKSIQDLAEYQNLQVQNESQLNKVEDEKLLKFAHEIITEYRESL